MVVVVVVVVVLRPRCPTVWRLCHCWVPPQLGDCSLSICLQSGDSDTVDPGLESHGGLGQDVGDGVFAEME